MNQPKKVEDLPPDLLPVLKQSGILTDRQFNEVRGRVLSGSFPTDSVALAKRLVKENLLTDYQARRLLSNKPHGLIVGRYVILDKVGSGAMGRVYKAQHRLMGRQVALKIIAPEIASNDRVVSRFQREIRLAGRLDHPNVVRAYDADQMGPILYIVMEYVAGQSLGQRMRARGPLPPLEVADHAAQAALGLAHAHAQGIVHRDIKPSNLMLGEDGRVRVLDLGLGVLLEADSQVTFATADGIAVGTIDYMSPEQACGQEVDGRSDLYSLGCTMYHLISGRVPFPSANPIERLGLRLSSRPTPLIEFLPDLPRDLCAVLDRLLASKSSDRYQSATEAASALQAIGQRRRPAPAPTPPSPEDVPSPSETLSSIPSEPEPEEARSAVLANPFADLPAWFLLLASLAARSPTLAFLALSAALLIAFAAGFVLALALR